jgi:hypothetical protein
MELDVFCRFAGLALTVASSAGGSIPSVLVASIIACASSLGCLRAVDFVRAMESVGAAVVVGSRCGADGHDGQRDAEDLATTDIGSTPEIKKARTVENSGIFNSNPRYTSPYPYEFSNRFIQDCHK